MNQPFLLLNQLAGWQAAHNHQVITADTLHLEPLPGESRPLTDADGSFGGLVVPTALALDQAGNLYVLDADTNRIHRFDACTEQFVTLKTPGGTGCAPRQFDWPQGMTISAKNDLFVCDTGNQRVQQFALKGMTLRAIWGPFQVTQQEDVWQLDCATDETLPQEMWQPWDVAVGHKGVYISDYGHGLIHWFSPSGEWRGAFDGDDGTGQTLHKPTHLALDQQGHLYIAQAEQPEVVILDAQGTFIKRVQWRHQVEADFTLTSLAVDSQGRVYLCVDGRLYLINAAHTQAIPIPTFKGKGHGVVVDTAGRPYISDCHHLCIVRLEPDVRYMTQGDVYLGPLDSQVYRCQWHRVILDGLIDAGTYIQVDTFTSDAPQTAVTVRNLPPHRWHTQQKRTHQGQGQWDCLIQSPPGRYLWTRLRLYGDQRHTPSVNSVQVVYPRQTSARFLPAVFQQDPTSGDFLERFLSIFDTIYGGISHQVRQMARYFDPDATPAVSHDPGQLDFLSWLASWIGLSIDRHWPEEKRRRLLKQAHQLYALRGTPAGMLLHLALYTDTQPHLLEHFKLRRWLFLNQARLGDNAILWGAAVTNRLQVGAHAQVGQFQLLDSGDPLRDPFHTHAHQFTVFMPFQADETQRQTIENIVEMAKPAHTQAHIHLVKPMMQIGVQAFIGVDTVIGQYPSGVVAGESVLGPESVLSPSENETAVPTMEVGKRARIGTTTVID